MGEKTKGVKKITWEIREELRESWKDFLISTLRPYSLQRQVSDLQTLHYESWVISSSTKIQQNYYQMAKLVLDTPATLEGLNQCKNRLTKPSCEKIVKAMMRIIWKKRCEEILEKVLKKIKKAETIGDSQKIDKDFIFPDFPG